MAELGLFQMYDLKEMSLLAELFLSCSILQFTFYGISTAYQRKSGFTVLNTQVYYIAILFIVLSFFLVLNEDLLTTNSFSSNNFIVNDYFSFISKLTVCLSSFLFLMVINTSFGDKPLQNNFEYVILITISILGLLLLCSSNDLITAYLAIELQSIAFYIMSAFKRDSSYSVESGLKYFIVGSLSSAFFLFGSALIYGSMGSLSFDDLQIFSSLHSNSPKFAVSVIQSDIFSLSLITQELHSLLFTNVLNLSDVSTSLIELSSTGSLIDWSLNSNLISITNLVGIDYPFFFNPTNLNFENNVLHSWIIGTAVLPFYYNLTDCLNYYTVIWANYNEVMHFNVGLISPLLSEMMHTWSSNLIVNSFSNDELLNSTFQLASLGFIFLCVSLFIKLSIAPFHFWSLDVYEGSPNTTTFFFAVVPKIGLFVLLTRICYIGFYSTFISFYQSFFLILGVISIFVGSIGGLEQRKLKTLLAYSSISHTGYLLLSFSTGSIEGVQMMFYYLIIYMVSSLCFWSVYLFLTPNQTIYFNKSNKELGDLILLKSSNPMLALILTITLFSMAGIPPMVGFVAKISVFLTVIKSSAYLIAVLSILLSVISTFYYIRLIKILYFENVLVGRLYLPISTKKALLTTLLALSLILLAIDPMLIYCLFYKAILFAI